jgi:hypothetical protein
VFCIACVITTTTMTAVLRSIFLQACNHTIIIITVPDPYSASVESFLQARTKQRRYPPTLPTVFGLLVYLRHFSAPVFEWKEIHRLYRIA